MANNAKHGIITGFLGQTTDRFRKYNDPKSLDEKFSLVADMEYLDGVEVVYPYEVPEAGDLKKLISKYKLNIAAINVNVKSEPEFINGGITNTDPGIRRKAIDMIKAAKDYAAEAGADKVQCCPLGDGYEYNFQFDYRRAWKHTIEAFGEAGEYRKEIPLFVEYKPSEVRGKCFVDSAAKALCLLNELKNKQVGVTIDFGHSVYGGETPAEALSLIAGSGYPYYIHINDNDVKWYWDYIAASRHFIAYVEFIYYLQEYGYNGYLTSDTSPMRLDIKKTFEANARWTEKIWNLLNNLDRNKFKQLIQGNNFLETWKFIEENIFFKGR